MKKFKHLKWISIVSFIILITGISFTVHAQSAWQQMTSMNSAKGGSQSVLIDTLIYVFGGFDGLKSIKSVEVYNTVSDEWTSKNDMPVDVAWTTAGAIGGKAYLAGGYSGSGASWFTRNTTYEYDPEQDSWQTKNTCLKQTGGNASCVFNDKLYVLGGAGGNQNEALVYDPAADTWDTKHEMLYKRSNESAACVFEDQIYVMGGEDLVGNAWSTVRVPEKYDLDENTWTALADMPVTALSHVAVVHNDKIYLFGGGRSHYGAVLNLIQEYDPATDSWKLMKNMPFGLAAMTAQKVDNYLYFMGGSKDNVTSTDEVWRFNLDSLQEGCEAVEIQGILETAGIGDVISLSANIYPLNLESFEEIIWASDDESVATVSEEGIVTAIGEGTATISASLKYGSCTDSFTLTVNPITGINSINGNYLAVYPNPAVEFITIRSNCKGNYAVKITSISGREVYNSTENGSEIILDVSSFETGIYFVAVRSHDFVVTKKFVKN